VRRHRRIVQACARQQPVKRHRPSAAGIAGSFFVIRLAISPKCARRRDTTSSQSRKRRMEPLWSPAAAIGGNRWQMGRTSTRLRKAKTVAVGCHRLPEKFHGKEGVDGSSPSEGSAKSPEIAWFVFRSSCRFSRVRWVWSRLWSFRVQNGVARRAASGRSFLPMFPSACGDCVDTSSLPSSAGHCCILGSCVGSAYMGGQP
jgi:hypothetical protein